MAGALPPSSNTTGLRYLPQVCAMIDPTRVEPVKLHVKVRVSGNGTMNDAHAAPFSARETQQEIARGAVVNSLDLPNGFVSNQCLRNLRSIFRVDVDHGENTCGETRLLHDFRDNHVRARRHFTVERVGEEAWQ